MRVEMAVAVGQSQRLCSCVHIYIIAAIPVRLFRFHTHDEEWDLDRGGWRTVMRRPTFHTNTQSAARTARPRPKIKGQVLSMACHGASRALAEPPAASATGHSEKRHCELWPHIFWVLAGASLTSEEGRGTALTAQLVGVL